MQTNDISAKDYSKSQLSNRAKCQRERRRSMCKAKDSIEWSNHADKDRRPNNQE